METRRLGSSGLDVPAAREPFHPAARESYIRQAYEVMARAPQHVYQILTKRPRRMAEVTSKMPNSLVHQPNLWHGTSVGMRQSIPRIEKLRQVPAAVRFFGR